MKSAIPLQQSKKCITLFVVGIVCSALAYAVYIINPLKLILDYKLKITQDSLAFELWRKPTIEVYLKVYIFNITNPAEFLNGEEKLKLQEIGPYVYQELLENHNVTWYENKTISYTPKRIIKFIPEMSVGDPKRELVHVPNVPMLGISSALHDAGFLINFPWTRLVNMLSSEPILNLTVHDYFWGYEDSLVHLAGTVVPNFINFRKFGLLDRMYDEGENVVTMNVGDNKNMIDEDGRYLSIVAYNGSPGMAQWGYREQQGNETYPENTSCNRLKGATEGTLFPSYLDKRAVFRVYRKAFCKAIPIVYNKTIWTDDGFEGYLYTMTDDFLDPPEQNPVNECYCRKMKKCLRKGLSDMTPCYYNIPTAMSLPHFLDADPSLGKNVEGLHPDRKKHSTHVILQPTIGIPMIINSRMQINLVMYHTTYNSRITPFNDITVPLFWTDLEIPSLPKDLGFLLKLMLQILPVVQTAMICVLTVVGVAATLLSLSGTLWIFSRQQEQHSQERRESTDLKVPLSYGQYTTIRIIPPVQRITSKTDLFS